MDWLGQSQYTAQTVYWSSLSSAISEVSWKLLISSNDLYNHDTNSYYFYFPRGMSSWSTIVMAMDFVWGFIYLEVFWCNEL